jgi:hypothetical protein
MRVNMNIPAATDTTLTQRNSRLKAERDRRFQAQKAKLRRVILLTAIAAAVVLGQFWLSGCTMAGGCSGVETAAQP